VKAPKHLDALIDALRCLPGVGPKAAQRMAYHLLQQDRGGAARLAGAIGRALDGIARCSRCNGFSDNDICETCSDSTRDPRLLCVVETPSDQLMIEQTAAFRGHYFVLMGRISPLDGSGPREIGLEALLRRVDGSPIEEVVLATNLTNEGEATAYYLGEILRGKGLSVTRIARGVPVGGELEFVDAGTLAQAVHDRRPA